jgi:L-ascorbate metabolism protein UlaG (beta-lactamase superfamily)
MKNIKCILASISLLLILSFSGIRASGFVVAEAIAIHSLGHGSLYFEYKGLVIYIDPFSIQADYSKLLPADLIFITHEHPDHYDLNALNKIKKGSTEMICTQTVKNLGTYSGSIHVINNGDSIVIKGISVKAVPAYNAINTSFHPKGIGNGYVFTFGKKKVYVAGDTENIPEMKNLGRIDIAFLPMNLPYTMTPAEAAEAAKIVKPDILYIYHFGNSDTASVRNLLHDQGMVIRMGKSDYFESDTRLVIPSKNKPKQEVK